MMPIRSPCSACNADPGIIHDAPRDESRDLAHQHAPVTTLDPHRHLLVLKTGLVTGRVEKLSLVVVDVRHLPLTGYRLTCTLKTFMKIEMRSARP